MPQTFHYGSFLWIQRTEEPQKHEISWAGLKAWYRHENTMQHCPYRVKNKLTFSRNNCLNSLLWFPRDFERKNTCYLVKSETKARKYVAVQQMLGKIRIPLCLLNSFCRLLNWETTKMLLHVVFNARCKDSGYRGPPPYHFTRQRTRRLIWSGKLSWSHR